MKVKVYVPKVVDLPSEYLPTLGKHIADSLGVNTSEVAATRGHFIRQAVKDGLLPELEDLIGQDGRVDLVCDPGMEIPLEFENRTFTLSELIEALKDKGAWDGVLSMPEG